MNKTMRQIATTRTAGPGHPFAGRAGEEGHVQSRWRRSQMRVAATEHRRQKTIDVFVIAPILVFVFVLAAQRSWAECTIRLSKIAESLDGHSTTRTTVRRVFHHDGYWYVFCGDVRDRVYCSFFVTSTDGINWSERKIGSGGDLAGGQYGAPDLPETAIVYGDQIYGCYSEKGELCIRSGTLARGNINWSPGHCIAAGPSDKTRGDFYFYYPDIMIEEDGSFSISLRHHHKLGTTQKLNPALVISANPRDITKWRAPRDLFALAPPEGVDAHENIPLPGGRRLVIVRSYCGLIDKELYKPGCPGNFYAVHYDGTNWLEPVDLGNSDGIAGSDKRLSAILDPGTGTVHLAYVEDSGTHFQNELRYRTLSAPYGVDDWSPPTTIATNVFTVMLGMDSSSVPARIAALYGDQLHEGGEVEPVWGSRWHTGRLYLKWFDGTGWESGRQLVSEKDDEYAWFPSVQQDVSGTFGVLYMKGGFENFKNTPKQLMFALVKPDDRAP